MPPPVPAALVHPNVSRLGVPTLLRLADTGPRKPLAAPDLPALARAIHRARGDKGLQLQDTPLRLTDHAQPVAGVSIWLLDPGTGERHRYLGWAHLAGGRREALQAALYAEES